MDECEPCEYCLGTGFIESLEHPGYPCEPVRILLKCLYCDNDFNENREDDDE